MKYETGTVTITEGSNVITGVDTLWLSQAWLVDSTIPKFLVLPFRGQAFYILRVVSNTSLLISRLIGALPGGVTSMTGEYAIAAEFSPNELPLPRQDDINKAGLLNRALIQIDELMQPLL